MLERLTPAIGCCLCIGCATTSPTASGHAAATPPPMQVARGSAEDAHGLVMCALGCWSGGLWSDARGVNELERADDAHRRCRELVRRVTGEDDPVRYERLRAIDEQEVTALRERVAAESRSDALSHLLVAIADVERETMYARRAADKVKRDIEVPKPADDRLADEVAADPALSQTRSFEALAGFPAGPFVHEARAVMLINALDRAELARGLPKHLKLDVVAAPYALLFGVAAPAHAAAPDQRLEPGAWLSYLSEVAAAAGHAVPPEARSLRERERMAWSGVAKGIADRLDDEARRIAETSPLRPVAEAIVRRLDVAYRADQAGLLEQGAHAAK